MKDSKDSSAFSFIVTVFFIFLFFKGVISIDERGIALEKRVRHLEEIADVQVQP